MGPAVLGGLGAAVARHPDGLAQLPFAILGHLAVQTHGAVLEIAEGSVGAAGGVVSVEVVLRIGRHVHRRGTHHDTGVGELGDALGQDHPGGIAFPVVPAGIFHVAEIGAETRNVGGTRQVRRTDQEQRAAEFFLAVAVDVAAPLGESRPVGLLFAGLGPHLGRVTFNVEQTVVLQGILGHGQMEGGNLLRHAVADLDQAVGQIGNQLVVSAQDVQGHVQVVGELLAHFILVRGGRRIGAVPGDAVFLGEIGPALPEQVAVERVGGAVAGGVVLVVAAALAGLAEHHFRAHRGALTVCHFQDGPGDVVPVAAVGRFVDVPAIGSKPVPRRAVHD